jgi:hypothetical protein
MMVYGFIHFNDEDPESLVALGDVLIPWADNHIAELNDGYEIASMTSDDLSESGVGDVSKSDILGVALGMDFTAGSHERFADAMVFERQEEIFSHYVTFERETLNGGDCFLDKTCSEFLAADDLHAEIALGIQFWSDYEVALRWLELDDGRSVLLHQLIGPEPTEFSVDFINVYQQYGFSFIYDNDAGQARRVQALWADGELLSSDAAEGSYLSLSISTMKTANSDVNDWMAPAAE